ncbi:MAG: tRNA (adenosine(37)-N6)-dimethylallyltransferase MiaA [Clostridia bacterium]|nr:tRNA (adenosine(37)-N6)-dimethylallyltransferase MiaA [Clostridia bacterium]
MKIPLIAIVGPTASGKTALSVDLSLRLNGEIVSCDSMQIYKDMHIASATPDEQEKKGVPHHLVEFLDRSESFSVADYVNLAHQKIKQINEKGKQPILVGGTGLYFNSLVDNISFSEEKVDESLRQSLETEFDKIGGEEMLKKLAEFDKAAADRLHPNNRKRIIRAFEVYISTGKTITQQQIDSKAVPSPYKPYIIGLAFKDREILYKRIEKRVDLMIEKGLLEEAEKAYNSRDNKTAIQAIGHKEFFEFFEGKASLEEAVEKLKTETRHYAKRQQTWFGRDDRINWIYLDCTDDVQDEAIKILERSGYFE